MARVLIYMIIKLAAEAQRRGEKETAKPQMNTDERR